jgi:hypothetical protein
LDRGRFGRRVRGAGRRGGRQRRTRTVTQCPDRLVRLLWRQPQSASLAVQHPTTGSRHATLLSQDLTNALDEVFHRPVVRGGYFFRPLRSHRRRRLRRVIGIPCPLRRRGRGSAFWQRRRFWSTHFPVLYRRSWDFDHRRPAGCLASVGTKPSFSYLSILPTSGYHLVLGRATFRFDSARTKRRQHTKAMLRRRDPPGWC